MKADHINPFILSVMSAFDTMLACPVRRRALSLKEHAVADHEYSGVIGLTGRAVGIVVLSLSRQVAVKATATMLMTDEASLQPQEIIDAVGELANMVAGAAKAKLEEFQLSISLPSVICGKGHEIAFPSNVRPICVAFDSEWGPLSVEFGLVEIVENAACGASIACASA